LIGFPFLPVLCASLRIETLDSSGACLGICPPIEKSFIVAGRSSLSRADIKITGFVGHFKVGKWFDVVQEWYQRAVLKGMVITGISVFYEYIGANLGAKDSAITLSKAL
jgi:hypothetical protein